MTVAACTSDSTRADDPPDGSATTSTQDVTETCDPKPCLTVVREVPMSAATTTDVYAPSDPGPWPTVVFLHGDPPSFYPLVEDVARGGAVVFDARWRTSGSLLTAMQDAACAVSFASGHARDYGGDQRVVVAGHSAGATVAMVAALTGNELLDAEDYEGDCAYNVFFDGAAAVIGLAGSYDPADHSADPRNALRESDPELYRRINPATHLGSNPDLVVHLLHGATDATISAEASVRFHEALREAGYDAELTVLDDVGHLLTSPEPPNPRVAYDAVVMAIVELATADADAS